RALPSSPTRRSSDLFSSDPEGNRVRVDIICHDLVKQGILPISPLHLFSFMEDDLQREEILQVCFRLIDISDEVWIYGDSEGCRKDRKSTRLNSSHVK